jgi:hypothetical protein
MFPVRARWARVSGGVKPGRHAWPLVYSSAT